MIELKNAKIILSKKTKQALFEFLEYYNQRNKNKIYSKKLYSKIKRNTKLIIKSFKFLVSGLKFLTTSNLKTLNQ
ncbi:MAG: hypothetical protein COS14_08980 [Bacteroidetes bacterium CG02_land_8_20_14_3_00_31_25]|nr:MAG: hypothetical protein COS14_08980 [Bacteroidetes bacterium CG02_land_8_20_14_3_00_31_25]